MDLLRYTQDAFGQRMLSGMNWDTLWLPVAAAAGIVVLHQIVRVARRRRRGASPGNGHRP